MPVGVRVGGGGGPTGQSRHRLIKETGDVAELTERENRRGRDQSPGAV